MGSSFPKPLTCKEEESYLKLFEDGDLDAKNTLIVRNLRLVAHVAKKYSGGNTNPDDLISIGTIGLIKAINTYSSKRATRLATYAAKCIENEMLSIRKHCIVACVFVINIYSVLCVRVWSMYEQSAVITSLLSLNSRNFFI